MLKAVVVGDKKPTLPHDSAKTPQTDGKQTKETEIKGEARNTDILADIKSELHSKHLPKQMR